MRKHREILNQSIEFLNSHGYHVLIHIWGDILPEYQRMRTYPDFAVYIDSFIKFVPGECRKLDVSRFMMWLEEFKLLFHVETNGLLSEYRLKNSKITIRTLGDIWSPDSWGKSTGKIITSKAQLREYAPQILPVRQFSGSPRMPFV